MASNSIENMAYCLGGISVHASMRTYFMTKEPEILFLNNVDELSLEIDRIDDKALRPAEHECKTPFYTFIMYPDAETVDNFSGDTRAYVENIKKIQESLGKRIEKLNENEFDALYDRLFDYGCRRALKGQEKYAEAAFQGCEYLLAERGKFLCRDNRLKLFRKYGAALSESMIFVHKQRHGSLEDRHILMHLCAISRDRIKACAIEFNPAEQLIVAESRLTVYQKANTFVSNNQVHQPVRNPFLPGFLQKWAQSWEFETWKEKYNEDHPEKVKMGYGPGALIVKNESFR